MKSLANIAVPEIICTTREQENCETYFIFGLIKCGHTETKGNVGRKVFEPYNAPVS